MAEPDGTGTAPEVTAMLGAGTAPAVVAEAGPAAGTARDMEAPQPTPAQTVGPFLAVVLPWPDGPEVVPAGTPGAMLLTGRLTDGNGDPVPDGLVEVWQADADGRFNHPDDPRGAVASSCRGFGRCPTDATGGFWFRTVKPGALPTGNGDGGIQAPHIDVSVFARGLLHRLVTRIYFPDEQAANDADPVLATLPAADRGMLVAVPRPDGGLRFDIRLQGDGETPFFRL